MPLRTPHLPNTSPLPTGEGQGEGSNKPLSDRDFRRALRKASTPAETKLWSMLRDRRFHTLKVRRQHSIGPYTVDFFCREANLVIEVDGSIHDDPARNAADTTRQLELAARGLRVVRVSNGDVLRQPEAALAAIELAMSESFLAREVDDTVAHSASLSTPWGERARVRGAHPALDPSPCPTPVGRGDDLGGVCAPPDSASLP